MKRALREGSKWRKWDLHIHTPSTRMANGYDKTTNGDADWAKFCKILHDSDVFAFGITDYFSLDSFFEFKSEYEKRYPNHSGKTFFPNIELRLHFGVHKSGAEVNIHVIFPPDLSKDQADNFMHRLELFNESGPTGRNISCNEAKGWDSSKLKGASVTLKAIHKAVVETFDGASMSNIEQYVLLVVSGRGDGISPGAGTMGPRKEVAIDQIDNGIHAIFSRGADSGYWLRTDRIVDPPGSRAKPTFGGCDAHSFDDLEKMLGKTGHDGSRHWETTWIKADLTWEGLLQTLAEPATRVKIAELEPDLKDDYRVIKEVRFTDCRNFPSRIVFNPNLNAIIGSRSSGKSSLLAHIAHSVDSQMTEGQQKAAGVDPGPAAGHVWDSIDDDYCEVVWGDDTQGGSVIYIPQNFLNRLSESPKRVTEYILPSVKSRNVDLYKEYEDVVRRNKEYKTEIERLVANWFDGVDKMQLLEKELAEFGNEESIKGQIESLDSQVSELRKQANLTELDGQTYRAVQDSLSSNEKCLAESRAEEAWLDAVSVRHGENQELRLRDEALATNISFVGIGAGVPASLKDEVELAIDDVRRFAMKRLGNVISRLSNRTVARMQALTLESEGLEKDNSELFERFKANESIVDLEKKRAAQDLNLQNRATVAADIDKCSEELDIIVSVISSTIASRDLELKDFVDHFNCEVSSYESLEFRAESGFDLDSLGNLLAKIDKGSRNDFISGRGESAQLEIFKVQQNVLGVLDGLASGGFKVKRAETPRNVGQLLLSESPTVRFGAALDGDVIGGFSSSTMTPGKQSLFALTLILSNAGAEWPLLIDQPEDDLDSRSIYLEIVKFIKLQKTRRQILMVTHNANLVVGSDAECVIVANRDGDDRKNQNNITFDYASGSLEDTKEAQQCEFELDRLGIREHVVELLDGGSEAFKKRREKYKL